MAGPTDREDRAKKLDFSLDSLSNQVRNLNTSAPNRFEGLDLSSLGQRRSALDSVTTAQSNLITRDADQAVSTAQGDTAARLASQGITSGSIFNNSVNNAGNNIRSNQFNSLSRLGIGRLGQENSIMDSTDRFALGKTSGAARTDQNNLQNLLRKFGISGNLQGQRQGLLGAFDDTSWLDDVVQVLNTVGNFIPGEGGGK